MKFKNSYNNTFAIAAPLMPHDIWNVALACDDNQKESKYVMQTTTTTTVKRKIHVKFRIEERKEEKITVITFKQTRETTFPAHFVFH